MKIRYEYSYKNESNISLVFKNDSDKIGKVNIRLVLRNDLLDKGGNIDIEVFPSFRKQGYGNLILANVISYIKQETKLRKLLLTCFEDDYASKKIIINNGALFARQFRNEGDSVDTLYYWINLYPFVIETERLILRETTLEDFDDLKSVISDAENMKFYPKPYDDNGVTRWLNWCITSYARRGFGLWAVIKKESGEYIGDCGLSMQNIDGDEVPEIGYHIKLTEHKKGYGFEAASAVRDYIFSTYDFDKLYSYMNANNVASYSLAKKNGMSFVKEYLDDGVLHKVFCIERKYWEKIKNY